VRNALSEAFSFLAKLSGDETANVYATCLHVRGLGLLEFKNGVSLSSYSPDVLKHIQNEEIGNIRYVRRVVPLHEVIREKDPLSILVKELPKLLDLIQKEDRWKIAVRKRQSELKERQLIELVAKLVPQGIVNLDQPDWIIQLEVLQNWIGFGVVRDFHVLRFIKKDQDPDSESKTEGFLYKEEFLE